MCELLNSRRLYYLILSSAQSLLSCKSSQIGEKGLKEKVLGGNWTNFLMNVNGKFKRNIFEWMTAKDEGKQSGTHM